MSVRLDGKVAAVTGAGSGIGRATALRFASEGARVIVKRCKGWTSPSPPGASNRLQAVADDVRAVSPEGREPLVMQVDITDRGSCARLVDAAVERFGRVDVLIQNAHHEGDWSPAVSADPDEWRGVFDVNLFGALHLVQLAVPPMQAAGGGSIVLVNSGAALRNPPNMGAYATSKAALAVLTRTLAVELGGSGIRVNGVFLGPVDGENLHRTGAGAARAVGVTTDEWLAEKAAEMPLGVIPPPDECARPIVFLASDYASQVTGQHLSVNGGQWCT
jgi:NAD(P)-dependent dehydrogenase (short-subunit alcohol dehydrogenase family)